MADTAIPTDVEGEVPEQSDDQAGERPKTARELMMEQLDQSRRERLKEDGVDLADDSADDADEDPDEPEEPVAPKKVKLKVDGEEREVDESAVMDAGIRALQKESAADRRLEEATRLLREAQIQVSKQTAPVEQPKAEKPEAKPDDGAEKEFIDALMTGDEDKARQAFRKALEASRPVVQETGRAAIPDPQRIAAEVKAQLSFESASEKFKGEYPEIVSDPYLAGIADQYLEVAIKSGDHKSWDSALTAAGKQTRDWIGKLKGEAQPTTPPTTQRTGLAEKKRGIDTIPSASSSASVAAEDEPESASSVIAAMKKARGQAL